jgi:hypothetical protein
MFVYEVASAFEAKCGSNMFGNEENVIYCSQAPLLSAFTTQGETKQLLTASVESEGEQTPSPLFT